MSAQSNGAVLDFAGLAKALEFAKSVDAEVKLEAGAIDIAIEAAKIAARTSRSQFGAAERRS